VAELGLDVPALEPATREAIATSRTATAARAGALARQAPRTSTERVVTAVDAAGAGVAAAQTTRPDARDDDDTWSFSTARPLLDLGLDRPAASLAGAVSMARESARERADARLLASLDGVDAAGGRARSGPLREAVDEVARGSDAPTQGVALFEITLAPSRPAETRLLEASSAFGDWSRIAPAIDRAARKKSIRFPPNGQGLRVVLRVEAALRLPDGRRLDDLGVRAGTTGFTVHDDAPPGESKVGLPSAKLELRGKVCSLTLTFGLTPAPIGGGCSPELFGARASRRVTTTLVSEERLSLAE
jgi:hypothetical protein